MRFLSRLRTACVAAFAGVVLGPALLATGAPAPEVSPDGKSLAGKFLVATPGMGDPRFAQTVVMMVQHNEKGAIGLIINRPLGERSVATLLEGAGEKPGDVTGSVKLHFGGPVQTELGFIIHSAEYRRAETVTIDGRVAMTASREIVRDIGLGKGPAKSLFTFGYAGWGPGQLEREMAREDWFIAAADLKILFDLDREQVWDAAMARRLREL